MTKGVLVIGGGVAGIQAALDLAESGIKVHIVERSPSLGGKMAQLDKTFPTLDCSLCILSPKLVTAARTPNIKIHTLCEVVKVEGTAGDFKATVQKKPRWVDEDKCIGCGLCAQKCPVRVPNEFEMGLSKRKAIYTPYPQSVPITYTIDTQNCLYHRTGRCRLCEKQCDAHAINFDQKMEEFTLDVGAIIVATGFEQLEPTMVKEYGYGIYENVLTSLQFERLQNASGPTGGLIVRPSDGTGPTDLLFIQCVGSRDLNACEYCSRICCMSSVKEAMVTLEHEPTIKNITILYMDIRAYGKGFEEFFQRAERDGIQFLRGRVAEIVEVEDTKNLIVKVEDTETGELKELETHMVVLASAIVPSHGNKELAKELGIKLDKDGFFKESHINAKPINSTREGIYICGCAQSPKDIPDSVAQAHAAAGKAMSSLFEYRVKEEKKKIEEIDVSGEPRIGVFVCRCGVNIGTVVDVPKVVEFAKTLPNVVYSMENTYTCSEDSQHKIEDAIKENNLNRIVIAACTPRTHEGIFKQTCAETGLNPYLLEMTNIRDQCSWVHMHEPEKATEKTKDLVRMAVGKARLLSPLDPFEVEIKGSTLVIGGGLVGIESAIDIAKQGFGVHLVEITPFLGGRVSQLGILYPENAYLKSVLKENYDLLNKLNVKIYTNSEVTDVKGFVGNFNITINTKGRGVDEKKCNLCGDCEKVCPIIVEERFDKCVTKRRAIYYEINSYPLAYAIDFKNCTKCGKCVEICKQKAITLDHESRIGNAEVGTIVLTIGSDLFNPTGKYGYGEFPNVITNMDLERFFALRSRKRLKINGRVPKNVAIIQCVGAQDKDGYPGCSRYCCQTAIKEAILLKAEGMDVSILYKHLRTFSKGTEHMYKMACELGVNFIRFTEERPPKIIDEGRGIEVFDELLGEFITIQVDAVVLSLAMVPREAETGKIQKMLKVPRSEDGFFLEMHPKLGPVETNTLGIYIAGCAQSPKDVADSITQASGAAAKASIPMAAGILETEPITSHINKEICINCGLCVEVCEYGAMQLIDGVTQVIPSLCHGCGTCSASCPRKAISMHHFTDEQLSAQVEGALSKAEEVMIIAFLCNWCSYAGADLAGVSRIQYPTNVRAIRVMCSGRVDPITVLDAFRKGADGVLIAGCHLGDCHYVAGIHEAQRKYKMLKKLMEYSGIEPQRLRLEMVSAAEGDRFANLIKEFTSEISILGPSPVRTNPMILDDIIVAQNESSNFRLRWLVGKERLLLNEMNVYGENTDPQLLEDTIDDAIATEFLRQKILKLIEEEALSIKEISKKINVPSDIVLKQTAILRQKGLVSLDRIDEKSPKYIAIAEGGRT